MSSVKLATAVGLIAGGAVLLTEHLLKKAEAPATLGNIAAGFVDTLSMGAQFVTDALAGLRETAATEPGPDAGTEFRDVHAE